MLQRPLCPEKACRPLGVQWVRGSKLRRSGKIPCTSNNGQTGAGGQTTVDRILQEHGVLLMPGCYDALSAKLLVAAGHQSAFLSGYAVSATLLGEPDVGLLTPPEMARKAGQICYAVPSITLLADADTGGGNVLNVQRTVHQLIAAGCKGCFLEDQEWPKRPGHIRGNEVISMDEHAAKVYAARQAIGDSDFFLVARTDARGTSAKRGMEESITRANLYMDAGADATFVGAPRNVDELIQIGEQTKGYRCCNMLEGGLTEMKTPQELKELGFQIIVHPLSGLFAAAKGLKDCYDNLAARGTTRDSALPMFDFGEFNALIGFEEKMALEESLTRSKSADEKLRVRVKGSTKPTAS